MQFQDRTSEVWRFVENELVSWLIDQLPNNMNSLALEYCTGNYDDADYDQILQLIGYSVSGIPYKNKDLYDIANNCDQLHAERDRYKNALEEIMKEFSEGYDVGETAIEMYYIAKGAVKSETK